MSSPLLLLLLLMLYLHGDLDVEGVALVFVTHDAEVRL